MEKVFKIMIIAGIISAVIFGFTKFSIESQNRAVDLVMDYNSLDSEDQLDSLDDLKELGLTSVALDMWSLKDLEDHGELIIAEGNELIFYQELSEQEFFESGVPIDRDSVYILIENEDIKNQLKDIILDDSPSKEVEFYDDLLVIPGDKEELLEDPILYSSQAVDIIVESGLDLVPRIPEDSSLDNFFQLKQELPEFDTVIFSGEEIVGYPDDLVELGQYMLDYEIKFGYIEPFVAEQDGSDILARTLDYQNMVRVHSTTDDTLDSLGVREGVDQFSRAVKERNVRVLYLKPFEEEEETQHFVSDLTAELIDSGYTLGSSSPFEFIENTALYRYLIMVSLVASISLWTYNFTTKYNWKSDNAPGRLSRFISGKRGPVSIFVAGILLLIITYSLRIQMIYLLAAFAVAVLVPLWIFNYLLYAVDKNKNFARRMNRSLKFYGICLAVSILAGIVVQGILLDNSYLLQVNMFRGVRAALVLPLILALILLLYFRLGNIRVLFERIYKIFDSPILYKHVLIGTLLILAGVLLLTRAGNHPLIAVSEFELVIRNLLEEIFQVRPRFKSFLIGQPILLLGIYLALKDKKNAWLLIPGLLGPINVINSFAHVHTPILISLTREILGAFLGMILGIGLIYIYRRWAEYGDKDRLFRLLWGE